MFLAEVLKFFLINFNKITEKYNDFQFCHKFTICLDFIYAGTGGQMTQVAAPGILKILDNNRDTNFDSIFFYCGTGGQKTQV